MIDAIEAAIDRAEGVDLRWGADDCMLWCADAIRAGTGTDPGEPYRGRYTDRDGAYRVIGPLGLGMALLRRAKALGWPPVDPDEAKLGDVGIIQTPTGQACVLRYTGDWWVGRLDRGVILVPVSRVRLAWSVS